MLEFKKFFYESDAGPIVGAHDNGIIGVNSKYVSVLVRPGEYRDKADELFGLKRRKKKIKL